MFVCACQCASWQVAPLDVWMDECAAAMLAVSFAHSCGAGSVRLYSAVWVYTTVCCLKVW